MVLKITQETFDNAVMENIEDLGMEPEEAVQEAVVQFGKQVCIRFFKSFILNLTQFKGVDLSNIIKKLAVTEDSMGIINQTIKTLENANNTKVDSKQIEIELENLKIECEKGIEMRVSAGRKT